MCKPLVIYIIPDEDVPKSFFVCAKACNYIKKETLAQVFSCEFCEISRNIFFYRTPSVAASVCKCVSLLTCKTWPNFFCKRKVPFFEEN